MRTKGIFTKDEIVDLYVEDKYSINKIAEMDGTTYGCIIKILHSEQVEMRPKGNHNGGVKYIKHGLNAGYQESGVSATTLARFRIVLHLGGKCVICGIEDLRVLELNHIHQRNNKLKQSDLVKIFNDECDNLEVRCANCNIIYEYENNRRTLPNRQSLEGWRKR